MNIDKRVERNSQSIIAIRELLSKIITNPESFIEREDIHKSLKSQGSLSKFNDESYGIHASSLNTIKRISESIFEGGFEDLDRLRIGAQEAIAKEKARKEQSNKTNKIGLAKRVLEHEAEILLLKGDLLLLTEILEISIQQGRSYAQKADKTVQAICIREQRELLDKMSLRKHSLPTNVKKLRED